jgi:hypothetical protein
MSNTAVEVRKSFDLTRAPAEEWNKAMIDVVSRNVFRGLTITEPQLHYCLTIADSLALNPLIGEIYFLPAKSRDGKGAAWQPYVGRNGLVKKATDRGYHYEAETVHENDKIRISRRKDGSIDVVHNYDPTKDRGDVVGAYAFLHDDSGRQKPAFFYAKVDEYRPTFTGENADWKMSVSPWGTTLSAMIEKCAMIGAGRKRLDLGNLLIDAEGAIVQQMAESGPHTAPPASAGTFEFSGLTGDAELAAELERATVAAGWPAAKCEMVLAGLSDEQLRGVVVDLGAVAEPPGAQEPPAGGDVASAAEPEPGVTEAQVVSDEEHREALEARQRDLNRRIAEAEHERDGYAVDELTAEQEIVAGELAAMADPGQSRLDV